MQRLVGQRRGVAVGALRGGRGGGGKSENEGFSAGRWSLSPTEWVCTKAFSSARQRLSSSGEAPLLFRLERV